MKTLTSIHWLAQVRLRFGLTQQQLANYLQLSISMIKLVETGRRTLNSEKMLKLAALEIEFSQIEKTAHQGSTDTVLSIYAASGRDHELEARYHDSRCTHLTNQLEKKLKKMREEYSVASIQLTNFREILKKHSEDKSPWIISIFHACSKLELKLAKCGIPEQKAVQLKIVMLRTEAALYKSIHPGYVHTTHEKPIV